MLGKRLQLPLVDFGDVKLQVRLSRIEVKDVWNLKGGDTLLGELEWPRRRANCVGNGQGCRPMVTIVVAEIGKPGIQRENCVGSIPANKMGRSEERRVGKECRSRR